MTPIGGAALMRARYRPVRRFELRASTTSEVCRRNRSAGTPDPRSGSAFPGQLRRHRWHPRSALPCRPLATMFGMERNHFEPEHLAFAEAFRSFADKELVPNYMEWERDGIAPREIFTKAGASGFLGMAVPEEYGGGGV